MAKKRGGSNRHKRSSNASSRTSPSSTPKKTNSPASQPPPSIEHPAVSAALIDAKLDTPNVTTEQIEEPPATLLALETAGNDEAKDNYSEKHPGEGDLEPSVIEEPAKTDTSDADQKMEASEDIQIGSDDKGKGIESKSETELNKDIQPHPKCENNTTEGIDTAEPDSSEVSQPTDASNAAVPEKKDRIMSEKYDIDILSAAMQPTIDSTNTTIVVNHAELIIGDEINSAFTSSIPQEQPQTQSENQSMLSEDETTESATDKPTNELDDLNAHVISNNRDIEDDVESTATHIEFPAADHTPLNESTILVRDEDTYNPAGMTRSVNMEDSQAELISSRFSEFSNPAVRDELYSPVLTKSNSNEDDAYANDQPPNYQESQAFDVNRKYMVTPSAFASVAEPDIVTHIRPASSTSRPQSRVSEKAQTSTPSQAEIPTINENELENENEGEAKLSDIENIGASYIQIDKPEDEKKMEVEETNEANGDTVDRFESKAQKSANEDIGETLNGTSEVETKEQAGDMVPEPKTPEPIESGSEATDMADKSIDNAADKTKELISNAEDEVYKNSEHLKSAANDTIESANRAIDSAVHDNEAALKGISSKAKKAVNTAEKNVKGAVDKVKKSGDKFAKKAKEEADEAEKAVRKRANDASPESIRTVAVISLVLGAISAYLYRLPGRQNQQLGFAGGVVTAILGLGATATALLRRK